MFALNIPTTTNIPELLSQRAELEASLKKNQEGFNQDRHLFVDQVRELIKTFNITKAEAFPPSKDKQASVDKDYSPDYFFRDPETGADWDGKGKRPGYLSGKKKTEAFRIYHATGTKFAPVVKPALVQGNSSSSGVAAPPQIIHTTAPIALVPVVDSAIVSSTLSASLTPETQAMQA